MTTPNSPADNFSSAQFRLRQGIVFLIGELALAGPAVYHPVVMGEFSGQIPKHGIAVALLSEDGQQLSALLSCLEATRLDGQ